MTRDEKIYAIVWSMTAWDEDRLFQWAQNKMFEKLNSQDDAAVDKKYKNCRHYIMGDED